MATQEQIEANRLNALVSLYQPQNPVEEFFVAQMADAQWRLARFTRVETGYFRHVLDGVRETETKCNKAFNRADHSRAQNTRLLGIAAHRDGNGARMLSVLPRYEATLRRAYYRALETLETRREEKLRNETLMADISHPPA